MCTINTTCLIVSPSWLLIVIILSSPPKARRFSILQQPQVIFFVCLPEKEKNLYNTKQTQLQKKHLWWKYTLFSHSNTDCQNVKQPVRVKAFLKKNLLSDGSLLTLYERAQPLFFHLFASHFWGLCYILSLYAQRYSKQVRKSNLANEQPHKSFARKVTQVPHEAVRLYEVFVHIYIT